MTFNGFAAIIPLISQNFKSIGRTSLVGICQKSSTWHNSPNSEWGHFRQSKGRGNIVVTGADTGSNSDRARSQNPSQILAAHSNPHQLPKGYCWLYAPRGPLKLRFGWQYTPHIHKWLFFYLKGDSPS